MAINQANIVNELERIVVSLDKNNFIYDFLLTYGYTKTTVTRLRSNDGRNLAINPRAGEVAFKKGIYFQPVEVGHSIYEIVDNLRLRPDVLKNNIRFVVVTDWVDLVAYDLKADERLECLINSLPENYTFFLPLAGFEKAAIYSENPADVKAAEQMGHLFDLIKEKNQPKSSKDIHALNVFLTRLLFCFFAEDTGIFENGQMSSAVASFTSDDGSDVAMFFNELFEVLNENDASPIRKSKPLHLRRFPYVNGGLFKNKVLVPEFGSKARRVLLDCSSLKWSEINPDIFGSMFQSVIDEEQRGSLGQHYTSVTNIMKVIQPLFLEQLEVALEDSKKSEAKLKALLDRVSKIKIFDPACGSGNFLIIAYKELRKIEMAIFKALGSVSMQAVIPISGIKLSQFYGIEIDDFAHEIALLSLWLTEHQMNQAFKGEFGHAPPSLPLKDSGNIFCGNSLRVEWEDACPKNKFDEVYVIGNPPFLGKGDRHVNQTDDMNFVFGDLKSAKNLDYVSCWFFKAAQYIQNSQSDFSFVSTNSISQGEQVGILWPSIFKKGLQIAFAYQTFPWRNNAKGNAGVHVVIIGITAKKNITKKIYIFSDGKLHTQVVKNIGPYLVESSNLAVTARSAPFSPVSKMMDGNNYANSTNLILSDYEREDLIKHEPLCEKWIRPLLGADEFLNGLKKYCLWLVQASESDIEKMPLVKKRVDATRAIRLASDRKKTREVDANVPHLFSEVRQPLSGSFIIVPRVTSERRLYVPVSILSYEIISTNANLIIPNGTIYEAGILMSSMHMDWLRAVGGRLESRYRYSVTLVYNTFPWPDIPDIRKRVIEKLTEKILLLRENYLDKTLADLYDPDLMPEELLAAHRELDLEVEKLYRDKPFKDSVERLGYLFGLYARSHPSEVLTMSVNGELW